MGPPAAPLDRVPPQALRDASARSTRHAVSHVRARGRTLRGRCAPRSVASRFCDSEPRTVGPVNEQAKGSESGCSSGWACAGSRQIRGCRSMPARPCPRCQKSHKGSFGLCDRCRTELAEDYFAGPSAIPEMLTVIEAARAVLITSPTVTTTGHRELARALDAFDQARTEDGDETRPGTPSARKVACARPATESTKTPERG